jgi:hypothetical protein
MKDSMCFVAPTLDVAALSAMMDGMIPLRTWDLMDFLEMALMLSHLVDFCSLTWQGGGVVSVSIL